MQLNSMIFIQALFLAVFIEGLFYFLCANKIPEIVKFLSSKPASTIRLMGMSAMITSLILLWFVN